MTVENRSNLNPLDRPADISEFELAELLDVIDALLDYSRAGTSHQDPGEYEVWRRATSVRERYRAAT